MIASRKTNIARNLVWGTFGTVINTILPFLSRTLIIYTIGVEYLGLGGLYSSILETLNLAEMGLSSAIIYNMYRPMAEHNVTTVCALLNFYRKTYRCIGIFILTIGLIISPFLPCLIKGEVSVDIDIWLLYYIFLSNAVVSYFCYGYKSCLITTSQRNDILEKINMILNIMFFLAQVVVIYCFWSYYLFVLVLIIKNIVVNIWVHYITKKLFPEYKCCGNIDVCTLKNIRKNIAGLIIGKLCVISRNSLDNIFISFYIGLHAVAVYGNYYSVFQAARKFLSVFINAISASIGNSVAIESVEKNYNDLKNITFIYSFISAWISIMIFSTCQSFMRVWVGNDLLLPMVDVLLIVLYFYIGSMGDIRSQYQNAAGLFWESRFYVIGETFFNVVLNIILGYYLGIHGIILATVISMLIFNFLWGSHIIFKYYFINYSLRDFFVLHLKYFGMFILTLIINSLIYSQINRVLGTELVFNIILSITFPPFFYGLIFYHTSTYDEVVDIILKLIKQKFISNKG